LPGTRREVLSIAELLSRAEVMLGSEASEQRLDELAANDDLCKFDFLHLATHGVLDEQFPMRSALFLARDQLKDQAERVLAGEAACDGRLTAEQLLRTLRLDAKLVTLSTCESGKGQANCTESHLGFSQALLLRGARSLVLSLWKVDDEAKALLMTRFYQHMLGQRAGLSNPLPKAEELREAKTWLRELTETEAHALVANLPRGEIKPQPGKPISAWGRPYEHPYFWASFVLISDPL